MQTIITEVNDNMAIEVYWQDEVILDVDVALVYVQSGQQDIKNYVDSISKPEIDNYVRTEAKPIVSEVVNNIASGLVDNYLDNVTIPTIDEHTSRQLSIYNDNASSKQSLIDNRVFEVEELALEVKTNAQNVLAQTSLAEQYTTSAKIYSDLCAEAKSVAKANADIVADNVQQINDIIANAKVEISKELNNPFSLLDYKWSEYELNNASWLLSNGAFHSGATYVAVYELLLNVYNGTETKDGVSVKLATEAYEDSDFVLNTADMTFRLPIKVKLASGASIVGNGMTLGLTDGTTNYGLNTYNPQYGNSLIGRTVSYGTDTGDNTNSGNITTAHKSLGVTTDPEKSGIETSLSGLKLYFYVGETIKDADVIAVSNVLTTIANADYVIESYNDGTNWYRVYKSGWCEQGGRVISTAYNNIDTTVTYLKPFANVDYSISAISISQIQSYPTVDVRSYNATGCVINRNNSYGFSWETKGYIA